MNLDRFRYAFGLSNKDVCPIRLGEGAMLCPCHRPLSVMVRVRDCIDTAETWAWCFTCRSGLQIHTGVFDDPRAVKSYKEWRDGQVTQQNA